MICLGEYVFFSNSTINESSQGLHYPQTGVLRTQRELPKSSVSVSVATRNFAFQPDQLGEMGNSQSPQWAHLEILSGWQIESTDLRRQSQSVFIVITLECKL